MESVHERIKQVRQTLGLSQAKFSKPIFISDSYLGGIELGLRNVNDRIIHLICTQYRVNEVWLREGTGEMFLEDSGDANIARVVAVFENLDPVFQEYVLAEMENLLETQNKLNKK